MIKKFRPSLLRKRRKYPIKRNEFGESARRRAFDCFDRGLRPAQVANEVGISPRTACRYFADWKRHRPKLDARYHFFQRVAQE